MLRAGRFQIHLLQTESLLLDGGAMFGVIPKVLWSKHIPSDDSNRIELATRPMLVRWDDRTVLVDAGVGAKSNEKFKSIYRITGPTAAQALAALGIEPSEVTDVIATHLHFDHCGGLTVWEDGQSNLVFPDARIHLQKAAWETAIKPNLREEASFLPENIEPLRRAKLELHEGRWSIAPGFDLIRHDGHTAGMQVPRIEAEGRIHWYPCDSLPTTAHLRPVWTTSYDLNPLLTIREKQEVLRDFAEHNGVMLYAHDPKIGASAVRLSGDRVEAGDAVPI